MQDDNKDKRKNENQKIKYGDNSVNNWFFHESNKVDNFLTRFILKRGKCTDERFKDDTAT